MQTRRQKQRAAFLRRQAVREGKPSTIRARRMAPKP